MAAFSKGEIVVRDDLESPDGAIVVDGLDEHGCILAHPLGGGFQFIVPAEELARFQRVEAAETIEVFSAGTFCIEGVDGEFLGWSDGSSWNGWEKPCFTREVAEQILKVSGFEWSYEAKADEFIVATLEDDEREHFAGELVHLGDGGSARVYFIGAGSWMWDEV